MQSYNTLKDKQKDEIRKTKYMFSCNKDYN